jgi:hypothetical protein
VSARHSHGGGQGHDHATGAAGNRRRLAIVLTLTASVLVVEVVGALLSGSLALLADAAHAFVDSAGLVTALIAATLALRPRSSWRWPATPIVSTPPTPDEAPLAAAVRPETDMAAPATTPRLCCSTVPACARYRQKSSRCGRSSD